MNTANVKHAAEPYFYRPSAYQWSPPDVSKFAGRTFMGYHRSDGRVGTANHWLFIPTVFCENRNLDVIREALHHELGYAVTDKYRMKAHLLRSEEHTSELQSLMRISYAVFCLKKKTKTYRNSHNTQDYITHSTYLERTLQ